MYPESHGFFRFKGILTRLNKGVVEEEAGRKDLRGECESVGEGTDSLRRADPGEVRETWGCGDVNSDTDDTCTSGVWDP